jgi:hypothetical protein
MADYFYKVIELQGKRVDLRTRNANLILAIMALYNCALWLEVFIDTHSVGFIIAIIVNATTTLDNHS